MEVSAVLIAGPMADQFVDDALEKGFAAATAGALTDVLEPTGAARALKALETAYSVGGSHNDPQAGTLRVSASARS
jgi:hypothetical protein